MPPTTFYCAYTSHSCLRLCRIRPTCSLYTV